LRFDKELLIFNDERIIYSTQYRAFLEDLIPADDSKEQKSPDGQPIEKLYVPDKLTLTNVGTLVLYDGDTKLWSSVDDVRDFDDMTLGMMPRNSTE